jgi:hypothetical protein
MFNYSLNTVYSCIYLCFMLTTYTGPRSVCCTGRVEHRTAQDTEHLTSSIKNLYIYLLINYFDRFFQSKLNAKK